MLNAYQNFRELRSDMAKNNDMHFIFMKK